MSAIGLSVHYKRYGEIFAGDLSALVGGLSFIKYRSRSKPLPAGTSFWKRFFIRNYYFRLSPGYVPYKSPGGWGKGRRKKNQGPQFYGQLAFGLGWGVLNGSLFNLELGIFNLLPLNQTRVTINLHLDLGVYTKA